MTSSLFLRIKPLNIKTMRGVTSNASVIRVAAMHNLREIVAEFGTRADSHINPARIALNYQLRGPDTAAGVADLAEALLDNAGLQKLRRDACMALELVFSLPQGSAVDHREYFAAAVAWADGFFNVPILSAAVHLDEPAKHCHVLLLPLVAGRMQGGALAGGPTKIKMMLADFQQQVGQRFGLTHQPRAKRLSKASRDTAGRMVLDVLKAHPERLNVPAVRDALVAALGQHHETLLPLLDLKLPATAKAKEKSFAAIMTAPCKPEPPAGKRTSIYVTKPMSIDVEPAGAANTPSEPSNVYLCVHVAPPAPAFPVHGQRQPVDETSLSGLQNSLHPPAGGDALRVEDIPEPSTTGQAAPASASTTPARRKLTAANRQPATVALAPSGHAETVSSEQLQAVSLAQPRGVRNFTDTHQAVHQLDTPAVDHHQGDADDTASQSAESSAHLDVSSSARISSPPTGQANATQHVGLVDHQVGAGHPAAKDALSFERISPAADATCRSPEYFAQHQVAATGRAPCANGKRPHKHPSKSGRIPTAAGGDLLKTQQVDQQAGQADAHRCSPAGGGHPGPQRGMVAEAEDDYQRHRDDEQPAETWCADLGEFVQTTGPPRGACHLYP